MGHSLCYSQACHFYIVRNPSPFYFFHMLENRDANSFDRNTAKKVCSLK